MNQTGQFLLLAFFVVLVPLVYWLISCAVRNGQNQSAAQQYTANPSGEEPEPVSVWQPPTCEIVLMVLLAALTLGVGLAIIFNYDTCRNMNMNKTTKNTSTLPLNALSQSPNSQTLSQTSSSASPSFPSSANPTETKLSLLDSPN